MYKNVLIGQYFLVFSVRNKLIKVAIECMYFAFKIIVNPTSDIIYCFVRETEYDGVFAFFGVIY